MRAIFFFPSESPDVEEYCSQKEEKKTIKFVQFLFCCDLCHKLGENEKPLGTESCKFRGKSPAVYLSRPLTSKVSAKGPESRRHRGDIKRWQRWRPSTGPFSGRIMEPSNTETHGGSFFFFFPDGPGLSSPSPPISRLTQRTTSGLVF